MAQKILCNPLRHIRNWLLLVYIVFYSIHETFETKELAHVVSRTPDGCNSPLISYKESGPYEVTLLDQTPIYGKEL